MKISHVLIIGLLTVTAAYADKYTVGVYNLTSYEGTRKVYTLTDIAKNSKTSRLPKCAIIQPIAGQQPSGRPTYAKQCTPGLSKFQVKMEGDLLDKVVITLKTTPGSDKATHKATYNIPASLRGKHWKLVVFQNTTTGTFHVCGWSKVPRSQAEAAVAGMGVSIIPGLTLAAMEKSMGYENAHKQFGISEEWQTQKCIAFKAL